jgi:hypothetical protein
MAKYIYSPDEGYGVNGIRGDRFTSVAGWEHGTVGFAGNVYSRLASENGIQPVDPAITASREPFRIGRFMLKILKMPAFFDPKVSAALRYIIEDTTTEFSGIQSYGFEVFNRTHGVIRQNSYYTGIYKENNGEFSIKVPETAGQLVRKTLDYWFYGMSDPKTGVAHFYGKDIRDLQPNKSISILYVLLGPTCRPEDIEYAAIYHDAVPSTPKHDHNNAGTLGETGSGVDHDITFMGTFDRGPEVDRLAAIIVDREGLYEERSQNAILPAYIYNNYMSADGGKENLSTSAVGMTLKDRLVDSLSGSITTGYGNFGKDDGVTVPHDAEFGKAFGKDGNISVGKPTDQWLEDLNKDNETDLEKRGDALDGISPKLSSGQKTQTESETAKK